jgi:sec-independent protein translocase protein TatA
MLPLQFLGSIGVQEVLIILLILVVLFGARRIPDLARGLGQGIRGFRAALRGEDDERPEDPARDDPSNRERPR